MTTLLPREAAAPGRSTSRAAGVASTPDAAKRRIPASSGRVPRPVPAPAIETSIETSAAIDRRRALSFAALILLLLGGGLCALLALNTASAAGEVRERELAEQVSTLSDTEQDLRRSVAALEAPAALAAAAQSLGMVPGEHPAFLVIGADGSVSVLGDPQAAPRPAPPQAPAPAPDPNASAPSAQPTPPATPDPSPSAPSAPPTPGPNTSAPSAPPATPDPNASAPSAPPATPDPNPSTPPASPSAPISEAGQ